jgi:hypothetical protein
MVSATVTAVWGRNTRRLQGRQPLYFLEQRQFLRAAYVFSSLEVKGGEKK